MGKRSLEHFCNKLFVNLTDRFVFYIPNNAVVKETIREANAHEFNNFIEKAIVLDWEKGFLEWEVEKYVYKEYQKSAILSKNVLLLIDKREKLEKSSFEYIFSKYLDQVRAMGLISFWLNDDLRIEQLTNRAVIANTIFELQVNIFEKHFEELEKVFCSEGISVINDNSSNNLGLQIPVLFDQLEKIETNQIENAKLIQSVVARSQERKKEEKPKVKKVKKILITENEAEQFLLSSVFGIKLQE